MNINNKENSSHSMTKLNIPKSNIEKILGIISILGTIMIWVYLIVIWRNVPHQIAKHFDFLGNANLWGGKESLLIIPICESVIYLITTINSKFPENFNSIINITKENAVRQYQNNRTFILWLSAEITGGFLFLEWKSVQVAMGKSSGIGIWYLPVFLIILFGTLVVYVYRMFNLK